MGASSSSIGSPGVATIPMTVMRALAAAGESVMFESTSRRRAKYDMRYKKRGNFLKTGVPISWSLTDVEGAVDDAPSRAGTDDFEVWVIARG